MTLAGRIASVLEVGGHAPWSLSASSRKPTFQVTEGVGATVALCWAAYPRDRAAKLREYEAALTANGLRVDHRGNHLYVHQPSHLEPCGCLANDAGAHRVGCPDHPEGVRG